MGEVSCFYVVWSLLGNYIEMQDSLSHQGKFIKHLAKSYLFFWILLRDLLSIIVDYSWY